MRKLLLGIPLLFSCNLYADLVADGLIEEIKGNYIKANELYSKACDDSVMGGCFGLGLNYSAGHGVKQDYIRANELYLKACDIGNMHACYKLSKNYGEGVGVNRDEDRAFEFSAKACDLAADGECSRLQFHAYGKGVLLDYTKANELYLGACNQGLSPACTILADNHYFGRGVTQDYSKSTKFYLKACDGGG
jgi:uncharacterized protein